jgi:hypothetical protein
MTVTSGRKPLAWRRAVRIQSSIASFEMPVLM